MSIKEEPLRWARYKTRSFFKIMFTLCNDEGQFGAEDDTLMGTGPNSCGYLQKINDLVSLMFTQIVYKLYFLKNNNKINIFQKSLIISIISVLKSLAIKIILPVCQ